MDTTSYQLTQVSDYTEITDGYYFVHHGTYGTKTINFECFYPWFLRLILNDILTDEEKQEFSDNHKSRSPKEASLMISRIDNNPNYINYNQVVLTDFFGACMDDINFGNPRGDAIGEPQSANAIMEEAKDQQDEEVANHEAEMEAESEVEGGHPEQQNIDSYIPRSPIR